MSQELHLSTCIQLRMTKNPFRKVTNFRHLLGCDTVAVGGLFEQETSFSRQGKRIIIRMFS